MTHADIKQTIRDFIASELLGPELMVDDDETLLNDGVVDSLGMVRLVNFIEESFAIDIPPPDLTIQNFRSIETIGAYLAAMLARGGTDLER